MRNTALRRVTSHSKFFGTFSGNSIGSRITLKLETHGFRSVWSDTLAAKIDERLRRPRFGFPGIFDRSPPPPKTLHWKHAPVEGEYFKIRGILCWAVLHLALIGRRLKGSDYSFLLEKWFEKLENDLVNHWLPDASIPVFSVKGEAKKLTSDLREMLKAFTNCENAEAIADIAWRFGLAELGKDRSEMFLKDLSRYIQEQEAMLRNIEITEMFEESNSWTWKDVVG